jgi:dTDP-4-amino-4,6-dideoxygalactose transaminase
MSRILLSPPHMSGRELEMVADAFASNWIAPLGPHVDAFERELAAGLGPGWHAVALSSGTAAIHLALVLLGVGPGDEVLCPTLTFVATANPILQVGATPVFLDSERRTWNLDPALLAEELGERRRAGRPMPKAAIVVDLYGQCADWQPILAACAEHGVPVIEDAAEALGATWDGRPAGSFGLLSVFSFNGNKIITTSGGGMLCSRDEALISRARFLATQARDPAPHYEHSVAGYNYRLSNLLAAVGRGQLEVLGERVARRREIFARYRELLGDLAGIDFMPEPPESRSNRWLTVLTIDPAAFGADREAVRLALDAEDIEARPVWKPMHLQPLYRGAPLRGGAVAEGLFERGLCLPSGSGLTEGEVERVGGVVRGCGRGE